MRTRRRPGYCWDRGQKSEQRLPYKAVEALVCLWAEPDERDEGLVDRSDPEVACSATPSPALQISEE